MSSSLLDGDSDSFGIFTAIRDEQGRVVDLRVECLKSAGPGAGSESTPSHDLPARISTMPDLIEIGLLKYCRSIFDALDPAAGAFRWTDSKSPDSRRFLLRAIRMGDNCFAQWRESTHASPDGEPVEAGGAELISKLAAANRRFQESEKNLKAITESLERRVAERTAESSARAEQLRFLALSLAEAESRERKRLGQLLHDDLQQLVSAAKLKAGMVRRIAKDEVVKENLQEVERLLEDAIAASRSLSIELSPPILHDAGLGAAVETIARVVQQRNKLKVSVQIDPRAEPQIEQVRALLFETIRELLQNIVQHAHATSIQIVTSISDSNNAIEIRVIDDGQGFDVGTLYKPASRTDKPFGLMEMRERLSYLGCTLTIRSEPGKGTDVRIVAPVELRPFEDQPVTPAPDSIQGKYPSVPSKKRGKMLVADDHAIFRNGLVNLLKDEPMLEVIGEAADGEQTVALARSLQPDILLLDITMPKLSGVQVASQLSKEMPGLKIVGLSMHDRQDMASAMRAAGAIAYFTKGGSWEVLLSFLRSLVSRSETK